VILREGQLGRFVVSATARTAEISRQDLAVCHKAVKVESRFRHPFRIAGRSRRDFRRLAMPVPGLFTKSVTDP
jgi:hypothetical protein